MVLLEVPTWTELGTILSVLLDTGHPTCRDYPPMGIEILGDREILLTDWFDELRERCHGHWEVGTRALGFRGHSQDVSRRSPHYDRKGQPSFANEDGVIDPPQPWNRTRSWQD